MNELDARDAMVRANRAQQLLEDDMIREAIAALRADAFTKLENTKPGQKDERESLYMYLKAIGNFEAHFSFVIEEGRVAKDWLDQYVASKRAAKRRPR
jgi:hypothetical protein